MAASPAQTGALGLAAGVVIGLVIGLSIRREMPAPPATGGVAASVAAVDQASTGAGAGSMAAAPGSREGAPSGASRGSTPAETARATPASALAAAIAALPDPGVPTGTGRIRGVVRLETGAGTLPGATIAIEQTDDGDDDEDASGAESPLEAATEQWIGRERRRRASRRSVVTGEGGAFAFDGLARGSFWLEATREGYRIEDRYAKPDEDVVLTATVVGGIEAAVVDAAGAAPRNALINLLNASGSHGFHNWTPRSPVIEVPPGVYIASAESTTTSWRSEGGNDHSATQRIVVRAGAPPVRVVLELRKVPSIRGRVVFPSEELGGDREGAMVYAVRLQGAARPDPRDLPQAIDGKQAIVWRDQGDKLYAIGGIEPGTWLVGVARGGRRGAILSSQLVEVTDGPAIASFVLPAVDRSRALHVRAFGPDGAPIRVVAVSVAGRRRGEDPSYIDTDVVSLAGGGLLVSLLESGEGPGGGDRPGGAAYDALVLDVDGEGAGRRRVELPAAKRSGTVDVRFDAPAVIEVTVPGYTAGLEEFVCVGLRRMDVPDAERDEEMTEGRRDRSGIDDEGRALLGPIAPGRYEVVLLVMPGGFGSGRFEAARAAVDAKTGSSAITLPLPALHTLDVRTRPGAELLLRHHGSPFSEQEATAGPTGHALFPRLPPGRYTLRGQDRDDAEAIPVEVPHAGELRYEPKPRAAPEEDK